jgi:NTP pyrophosphatase (non-canonical NTP hydrolase)
MEKLVKGLNESANIIFENNKAKGFWDKERNKGEMLMLVVSELGEAMEAIRKDRYADTYRIDELLADGCNWENSTSSILNVFNRDIKDTFEDEIADAIIRLLDMSAGLGIDIEKHINAKVNYNTTRPLKHGKAL